MIPFVSQPFLHKTKNADLVAKIGGNALLISYLSLATNLYLAMFLDYQEHLGLFNGLVILSLVGNLASFGIGLFGALRFSPTQLRFALLLAGNLAMLWLVSVVS